MKLKYLIPATLLLATTANAAEVSSTLTFTNDYRFRGISLTAGDAAVQGSMDLSLENGVYAGVWGSNVDFGDDANLEVDYYIGYGAEISEDLSWDAMLAYYTFPGYDAADIDYAELIASLYYGDFTFQYAYANSYGNTSEVGQYVAVNYSFEVADQFNVDLHAGHSFGDYWEDIDIGDYSDYSIGVSKNISGLDLSVSYLFNDVDSVNEIDSGLFRNDDTLLITLGRSF